MIDFFALFIFLEQYYSYYSHVGNEKEMVCSCDYCLDSDIDIVDWKQKSSKSL